ncbi:hypothetical protein GCM10011309_01580 [Litorimonas cladophorae]|uniref:Uncharacterized protein n=1 Tax=Litorimonas cladophorae TaxID=1220491 RepID=A0A918KA68_9PROT|nr:hypothetical protein GCM10011309_01580 [Litorimonas cladophorae]
MSPYLGGEPKGSQGEDLEGEFARCQDYRVPELIKAQKAYQSQANHHRCEEFLADRSAGHK